MVWIGIHESMLSWTGWSRWKYSIILILVFKICLNVWKSIDLPLFTMNHDSIILLRLWMKSLRTFVHLILIATSLSLIVLRWSFMNTILDMLILTYHLLIPINCLKTTHSVHLVSLVKVVIFNFFGTISWFLLVLRASEHSMLILKLLPVYSVWRSLSWIILNQFIALSCV